ncbi:hypothetical protein [Ensifer aridi]|uniref:hypothetical protein n=1 Tax=Ensifer aridi TaxID=1708715 RepID=UPI00040BB9B2|nr:hypothetical protein [Ensifer aridi]
MLSLIKTSAIAALTLSLAAGSAFAAEHHGHEDRGMSSSGGNGAYYPGISNEDDSMPLAAPVDQTTASIAVRTPRLSNILGELRAANHRMDVKRSEGELNAVAFNRMRREEADIRARAVRVADLHGGMIPNRSYAQLQKDVRRLDWSIARST